MAEEAIRAQCLAGVVAREEAVRAIGTRSLAIDIYVWLAYRLHSLTKPMQVSWPAVHAQFGAGFALMKHLKPRFTDALKIALAVYPEAHVSVENRAYSAPVCPCRPED